jgi:hypothetical protein
MASDDSQRRSTYHEEGQKETGQDFGKASGFRRFLSDNTMVITLIVFAFVLSERGGGSLCYQKGEISSCILRR